MSETRAEKPLDKIITDGGFVGIFRKIACIGDSLSSGEFEALDAEGNRSYHDMYDYSWGQFMARTAGCQVYNFSCGGMHAAWYLDTFADEHGLWSRDLASQAYIMALWVNDITTILNGDREMGQLSDIDPTNWRNNKRTAIGDYARILQRYREIAPDAFFFLMTIPDDGQKTPRTQLEEKHRELLLGLVDMFPNTYALDFRKYAPKYDADFCRDYFVGGHMNPMGYALTARYVISYIDFLIRHDMKKFSQVGFINTPWKYIE